MSRKEYSYIIDDSCHFISVADVMFQQDTYSFFEGELVVLCFNTSSELEREETLVLRAEETGTASGECPWNVELWGRAKT